MNTIDVLIILSTILVVMYHIKATDEKWEKINRKLHEERSKHEGNI